MNFQGMMLFMGLNFIMVVLSALRSITTARGGRHIAALFNTTSYTFYSAVVFFMSDQQLWFVIFTTAICNLIGYYVADGLFRKLQKDKLWRITATYLNDAPEKVIEKFRELGIKFTKIEIENGTVFDIYSYSTKQSNFIKEVFEDVGIKHFHVIEVQKKL